MAPFEVVIFHHLPGEHRAWCTAATAAELERAGIAKRPDDDRQPSQPLRRAKGQALGPNIGYRDADEA